MNCKKKMVITPNNMFTELHSNKAESWIDHLHQRQTAIVPSLIWSWQLEEGHCLLNIKDKKNNIWSDKAY